MLGLLFCLSQSLALFLEAVGILRAATPGMVPKVLCCFFYPRNPKLIAWAEY